MATEIVRYNSKHDDAIAAVQTHMWSGSPERNAAYFRWKYLDNPYLPEPVARLAFDKGRLVAMRGVYGAAWETDTGSVVNIPCADDMVVDPAYRNRGFVRPVMDALFQDLEARGFPLVFSLSAAPVTLVTSLAMGWYSAGSVDAVVHVPRATVLARRARARVEALPGSGPLVRQMRLPVERAPFRALDAYREARDHITIAREPRINEMAALVARGHGTAHLRHVRDARYYQWRLRNPLVEYRYLYWDDGSLKGYLILRRSTSDRGDAVRVAVVDWEAVNEDVHLALLDHALLAGRFAKLETWSATLTNSLRTALLTRGFRPTETRSVARPGHHILVRAVGPGSSPSLDGRALTDLSAWDLRPIASMAN